jgi:hypothetical protein
MSMPTSRKSKRFETQAAELAFAVPQVIAHRLTRMALAGHAPSARDRREFHRMGAEKLEAFYESWMAMAMHAWGAQNSLWQSLWLPWLGGAALPSSFFSGFTHSMLGKGMAPVHRRAVANAKRLARTKLR